MCWLVHKPADVVIPEDLLKCAYTRNDDGFGIMYFDHDTKKVVIEKVLPKTFDDVLVLYNKHKHRELGIHFRMRTSGATNLDMVHPFKVLDKDADGHDVYMMHNGILGGVKTTATHSDTYHLAEEHMKPLLRLNVELLYEQQFKNLMVGFIGRTNKLLLLDDNGRFTRIYQVGNDSVAFDDGFWCSNTYAITGHKELGYDLEKNKSFVKEAKPETPFYQSGNGRNYSKNWDDEDQWTDNYGYGYGAGRNYLNWQDPLKPTPTSTSTTTGTTASASSIKTVKPQVAITSAVFNSSTTSDGTVVHTRKSRDELKTQGTMNFSADGKNVTGHVTGDGKVVSLTNPGQESYVRMTPEFLATMNDDDIWDWLVTYPEEAAEFLIGVKEDMF